MPKVAFLDIDGTLVAGQAQQGLIRLFREKDRMTFIESYRLIAMFILYKLGLYSNVEEILNAGLRSLKGMSVGDANLLADRYVEGDVRKRIFPKALELIGDLKSQGFKIVLLSSAIDLIVSKIARLISADDYICTELATDGGFYTGGTKKGLVYGPEKTARMVAYAATVGAVLSESVAYADHETDLDMLKTVGKGYIANPNRRTRSVAARNGLDIIDLRS